MSSQPPPAAPLDDLPLTRGAAVRGASWAVSGSILRYALASSTTLVLVRLLSPSDIGLVAVTSIAQTLISHVASVGFHDALIQRPHLDRDDLNSAFWSIFAVAAVFAVLVMAAAWPIAALYTEPRLGPILVGVALASLLRAPAMPARALLNRRLDFRTPVLARLIGMALAGTCAVLLALAGAGPWALVAHLAVFNAAVSWWVLRVTGWRPARRIARPALRSLWSFAPSVSVLTIASYITVEADNQLIAYRLGAQPLGLYALAYNLMIWPVRDVLGGVSTVLYPVFARLQDDRARLQAAYLEGVQIASLFAFPVLIFLIITAPVLLPWLFGPRWEPAVLPLQILAVGGLREAPMMLNWAIYRTLNRPQLHMLLGLTNLACFLPAYVIGLEWGIEGVALFYVLTGLLLHPVSLWLVLRVLNLSCMRWLWAQAPALLGTLIMLPAATLILHLTRPACSTTITLLVTLAAALVSYALVLLLWRPAPVRYVLAWRPRDLLRECSK